MSAGLGAPAWLLLATVSVAILLAPAGQLASRAEAPRRAAHPSAIYLGEPAVLERPTSTSLMLEMQEVAPEAAPLGPSNASTSPARVYTNQFVIQVKGGEAEARKLASKHGFVYLNHILDDFYHLEHSRLAKRSLSATQGVLNTSSIQDEPEVSRLDSSTS